MASYLLDANVLLRVPQTESDQHDEAAAAVEALLSRGEDLCITPQVVVEFWCAATRPVEANGLGIEPSFLAAYVGGLLADFSMLEDNKDVFPEWLGLVASHGVRGKKTHDTRLAAVMLAHGVDHLLTFNVDDFRRYQEIKAVHPADVK